MSQWSPKDIPDLSGKVVLVTGGNSGIGLETSKHLLQHNAKVYIASRQSQKTTDAVAKLKAETGKDAHVIPIDLTDLHTVRKAAELFLSQESKLDILINNAGVMANPVHELTKDGYDIQFGTNVMAHFHLTTLLLPAILATPNPRIINVSSIGHQFAPRGGLTLDAMKGAKSGTSIPVLNMIQRYRWYGQSKLGNILFTNELVKRYGDKGLVSISCHPGYIKTDLARNETRLTHLLSVMAHDVTYGATTQLYAATAPEAAHLSGKYLVPLCKESPTSAYGTDEKLAEKMWSWIEGELKSF